MAKSNAKKVGMLLILQSFAPLFLLLGLKNCTWKDFALCEKFFAGLFSSEWLPVIRKTVGHSEFCRMLVLLLCSVWLLLSLFCAFVFKDSQTA